MTLLQGLLAPIFLHVLLVISVGLRTVKARVQSVKSGETPLKQIALDTSAWPANVRKLGNNFDNQFDMPMMWYGLTALAIGTGKVDVVLVTLSWMFLLARVIHMVIHTTSNRIPYRMFAYLGGCVAILLMWFWFALRIFVLG